MSPTEVLRAKSSYVLQSVERALGQFTVARAALAVGGEEVDDPDDGLAIADRVSESYLSELFGLAQRSTRGTSLAAEVLHLRVLAESLAIYEIRNACAHPNRPFFAHYWYRVASLAQDPSFRLLGLDSVSDALANAENNSFTEGETGWTIELRRVVSNNLPISFEHDRTGLVGREQLISQLVRQLVSGRFPTIALVAPGGLGKTALALEALKKIAYSAAGESALEGVVFVSIKSERLTHRGIEVFDTPPTVEDLEDRLTESISRLFDENLQSDLAQLVVDHGQKALLICLDNLESVLLGSALEFEEFLSRLPSQWRVLITSRIPLNSANCINVGALPPSAGVHLATSYSRSLGLQLERSSLTRISGICSNNPLAMKLTIDAISSGLGIDAALESSLSGTLTFSYELLLDSLGDVQILVLEVLFSAGAISRTDIALILDLDAEAVAEAVGRLARTSLITSSIDAGIELYSLNDSIRELLRTDPRNLELRGQISSKVADRRKLADRIDLDSEQVAFAKYSVYYVPPGSPVVLREIAQFLKRGIDAEIKTALKKLTIIEPDCSRIDTFWLLRGMVLQKFKDPQAQHALQRAVDIGGELRAKMALGQWLIRNKSYSDAADVFASIELTGGCDALVVGQANAERNIRGLLLATLFSERYEDVMRMTVQYVNVLSLGMMICTMRASAARMLFHESRDDLFLEECISVIDVGIKTYGYASDLAKEGMKLLHDSWVLAKSAKLELPNAERIATFAISHYKNLISNAPEKFLMEEDWHWLNIVDIAACLPASSDERAALQAIAEGAEASGGSVISIPVTVCDFNHPSSHGYRFGYDRDGVRHHIKIETFEGGMLEWLRILPRRQLYIVPGQTSDDGRAPSAERASLWPILES